MGCTQVQVKQPQKATSRTHTKDSTEAERSVGASAGPLYLLRIGAEARTQNTSSSSSSTAITSVASSKSLARVCLARRDFPFSQVDLETAPPSMLSARAHRTYPTDGTLLAPDREVTDLYISRLDRFLQDVSERPQVLEEVVYTSRCDTDETPARTARQIVHL
mmetsp:Transcript_26799/g.61787  ORF Transcript_26799/g.61787 Transcript_26799/m.61787 type:complete len:163 (-) Transcript_26799:13-501(-)